MPQPRSPRRTRSLRAIPIVHFPKKAREDTALDEVTSNTEPGENTLSGVDDPDDSPREYLVEVPRVVGARFNPERVQRLLKGQQPGYPFPPLSGADVTELSYFAHFLFEEERYQDAQWVLEALVASGVVEAFPYSLLGTVYLAQRDLNRALALFEAALAMAPEDLAAHVYRAEVRLRQGKPSLAMADLKLAIERGDPDDPFTERAAELIKLARRARRK